MLVLVYGHFNVITFTYSKFTCLPLLGFYAYLFSKYSNARDENLDGF
jgi:hypothetical protein